MRRSSIVLAILCFSGGLALAQGPVIAQNGVLDAASYTPNIAQGSVFVVKGTNLCGPGLVQAALPLPKTLNNVAITFTPVGGGPGINAWMVYTYNQGGVTQLAAVLPSTAAAGAYNVTVSNSGLVSAASRTNVTVRKFGIITANGSGAGRAVIQNFISETQLDLNRFTSGNIGGYTMSPAKPGQTLILWGTGLGPVSSNEESAPAPVDLRSQANVTVLVGDVEIAPFWAGRAQSLPGTDQINFTLPANAPVGCSVPLQVRVGGEVSNYTTVAITNAGDACTHPTLSRETLARLDQGGTLTSGSFSLGTTSISLEGLSLTSDTVSGGFFRYTADQLNEADLMPVASGSCQVYRRVGTSDEVASGPGAVALDAGAALSLNGGSVSNRSIPREPGHVYAALLGTGMSSSLTAGTYTLTGTGGPDVGAFTARLTLAAPLRVNALPAAISRSQNLTIGWTGGGSDFVTITGMSGSRIGGSESNPVYDAGVFVCTTTADKGSFTVPSSVLAQLPRTPPGAMGGDGMGTLAVLSTSVPSSSSGRFTAPLTAGGTVDAVFLGTSGATAMTSYQ